jgi:ubiquinone/menaquinone biosynthesis C-methylase UbiE
LRKSHKRFGELHFDSLLPNLRGRVLDIGCGANPRWLRFNSSASVCGLDSSGSRIFTAKSSIQQADGRYVLVRGEAESLPFHSACFDAITIAFTLCAVRDVDRACQEAYRVAKPGAQVLVVEHVRSKWLPAAVVQYIYSEFRAKLQRRCRADREPLDDLVAAGFHIVQNVRSRHLGPIEFIMASVPGGE